MKLHHSGTRPNSSSVTPARSRRRVDDPQPASEWPEGGLCNSMDSAGFFIEGRLSDANLVAIRACWRCPILAACDLDFSGRPANRREHRIKGGKAYNSRGMPFVPVRLRKAREAFEKGN